MHLYVFDRRGSIQLLDVTVLEINASNVAFRNDVSAESETCQRDNGGRDHIRAQEPAKTHARRFHRNYFRIVGQLRGKEDDGNEDEERTKEVGKIRYEVEVIIERYLCPRYVGLLKFINLLVVIKDDSNRNDNANQEDVRAEKLINDVTIQPSK